MAVATAKTSSKTMKATATPATSGQPVPGKVAKQVVATAPKTAAKVKPARKSAAKTVPGNASVAAFLDAVPDAGRRADAQALVRMMHAATGCEPVLWGTAIVGFDRYRYRYASGQEGDWPIIGFSPRKTALVLYLLPGFDGYEALLSKLGKHTTGKSCLYLKRLSDADPAVLEALVVESVAEMRRRYPR